MTALGDAHVSLFSDGGSNPPASTIHIHNFDLEDRVYMFYVDDDLFDVTIAELLGLSNFFLATYDLNAKQLSQIAPVITVFSVVAQVPCC